MALIELKKNTGPSPWHIMMAGFDPHPARAHGIRTLDFTLVNGSRFEMALKGIDWGEYPSPDPWTLYGYQVNLPKGYYYSDPKERVVEVEFDPFHKTGEVELELVSPCHMENLHSSLGDGVLMGSCAKCHQNVLRLNPRTGIQEWLDGESPWTERNDLRPVGVKVFKQVWITYIPPEGSDRAKFIVDTFSPEEERSYPIDPSSLTELVPGALWVDHNHPTRPSRAVSPSYYMIRGFFEDIPEEQQNQLLGKEVASRLRIAERSGVRWDGVPVALDMDMPKINFAQFT